MAIMDRLLTFAASQALTGTTETASTDVYDAGSAIKLFEGSGAKAKLALLVSAAGGTSPTFRARLVGADNAALSSNVVTLADTGVSAAIAAADIPLKYALTPENQATAKRYYGVLFTLGGTSPTATASAHIASDGVQNNQLK